MDPKFIGLSLFSSAGIGETYINDYVDIKLSNELVKNRCELYKHFHPNTEIICGDIKDKYDEILEKSIKYKIDFILATPPCQSFSKAGKQEICDHRDILFLHVINISKIIKPKYILIENVPEFIKLNIDIDNKTTTVLEVIQNGLSDFYNINYDILNAADYNTAQNRKRAIILLSLKSEREWKIYRPKLKKLTVFDMISHLPNLESGESSNIHPWHKAKTHNDNHILWMKHTPTGKTAFDNEVHYPQKDGRKIKGFRTTYKRIEWDSPAPTITMANGSISSQNNVHPGNMKNGLYDNARVLTVYELMLLSGLDDKWVPPSNCPDNLLRHVLGECVPPLLIRYLMEGMFIEEEIDDKVPEYKNLESKTLKELINMCRDMKIKGYSKKKKSEIVEMIKVNLC